MKTLSYLFALLFLAGIVTTSCSKSDTGSAGNGNNDTPGKDNGNGNGSDDSSPYFEYAVGSGKTVRVNCSEIAFAAQTGDVFTGVYATSASTKATFSFAFPAFSGTVAKMTVGLYPLKEFIGYAYDTVAFHFSLKAPQTPGGTDYFISVAPTADNHKNQVTKIDKGAIENGKQIYWVTGQYNLPAVNANKETTSISGNYRFKLLTLQSATVVLPEVKTISISDTTSTSAVAKAEVTFDGNGTVTARGVCWSMGTKPTLADNKTVNESGLGSFSANIKDLMVNRKYYVRAYATNSKGTVYGNELEFTSKANLSEITTGKVEDNFPTYASAFVTMGENGGAPATSAGVCWSTTVNPTILNDKTDVANSFPTYALPMRPLKPNTTYYYRAFSTNSAGTAYGKQLSFKTGAFVFGSMKDIDGNVYKTIKIGNKTWMAENLRVTRYRNGDAIPQVTDASSWSQLKTGAWCFYDNDEKNDLKYGKLYNFYTATDPRKIAPAGWHVPTPDEVRELFFSFSSMKDDPRDTGSDYWKTPNSATNKTGFSAVGSGLRRGPFMFLRERAVFWTSEMFHSEAGRSFDINSDDDWLQSNNAGAAIRLVKD
nr:FISUMP domain-containing protein [Pedobacter panaciterrae]